jgi:hypothetical protein
VVDGVAVGRVFGVSSVDDGTSTVTVTSVPVTSDIMDSTMIDDDAEV